MKKLFLITVVLSICAAAYGQTPDSIPDRVYHDSLTTPSWDSNKHPQKLATNENTKYCCPKCDFCDVQAGTCLNHHLMLIRQGTYYCETCHTTSDKPQKCSKCGKNMKKMDCKES